VTLEVGALLAVIDKYIGGCGSRLLRRWRGYQGGTVAVAIPEDPFLIELVRLNDEDGQLMIGSSANLTGQGQEVAV
jgi:tRNA A37 threonylcarbamoyladenosine synthetase subunit TsaC/SUA5/YrdC